MPEYAETSSLGDSTTWEPSVMSGTQSGALLSGMMTARDSNLLGSRTGSIDEDEDEYSTTVRLLLPDTVGAADITALPVLL